MAHNQQHNVKVGTRGCIICAGVVAVCVLHPKNKNKNTRTLQNIRKSGKGSFIFFYVTPLACALPEPGKNWPEIYDDDDDNDSYKMIRNNDHGIRSESTRSTFLWLHSPQRYCFVCVSYNF